MKEGTYNNIYTIDEMREGIFEQHEADVLHRVRYDMVSLLVHYFDTNDKVRKFCEKNDMEREDLVMFRSTTDYYVYFGDKYVIPEYAKCRAKYGYHTTKTCDDDELDDFMCFLKHYISAMCWIEGGAPQVRRKKVA